MCFEKWGLAELLVASMPWDGTSAAAGSEGIDWRMSAAAWPRDLAAVNGSSPSDLGGRRIPGRRSVSDNLRRQMCLRIRAKHDPLISDIGRRGWRAERLG